MKNKLLNKTFLAIFSAVFAIIVLVDTIAFYIAFQNNIRKSQQFTQQENQQCVDRITTKLNDIFIDYNQLALDLSKMTWVIKLSSLTDAFDNDFSYGIRTEIINNYLFNPGVNDMAQSRFVYFPHRSLIVGANAWNDAGYYVHKMLGIPYAERHEVLNIIGMRKSISNLFLPISDSGSFASSTNRILVSFPIGNNINMSKAYLCVVLKVDALADTLNGYMTQGVSGLKVMDADKVNTFLELGSENDDSLVQKRTLNIVNWNMEYYISPSIVTMNQESTQYYLPYLILLVVGLIVAFVIAHYVFHPLESLLHRINGANSEKNVIKDLNNTVTDILYKYQESRRFTILHHLMSGYFDTDDPEETVLGFTNHMMMQVYVCVPKSKEGVNTEWVKHIDQLFSNMPDVQCQMLESYDKSFALITGYKTNEAIDLYSDVILDACMFDGINEVFVGNISQGFIGISISYQSALERKFILSNNGQPGYYFPLEWENTFISSLRQGNGSVAISILNKVLTENEKRLTKGNIGRNDLYRLTSRLVTDLHRSVNEMNMDENILNQVKQIAKLGDWSALYQEIIHVAEVICQIVSSKSNTELQPEYRIVEYVDTHYHEADLSVTTLQSVFGISATTLNKCIKSVTGQTFLPYLTMRRMEEAKTLMKNDTMKVSAIAELVGYENEYSFRRAFQHYTGVRIQDYQQFSSDETAASDPAMNESV